MHDYVIVAAGAVGSRLLFRRGPLTSNMAEVAAFVSSDSSVPERASDRLRTGAG